MFAILHRIESQLGHVHAGQKRILEMISTLEQKLMSSLELLQAQVAQSTTVMSSAMTLISGLHSQLEAAIDAAKAGDNHAALDALSASLSSGTSALAAAVAANTGADAVSGSTDSATIVAGSAPAGGTVDGGAATGLSSGDSLAGVDTVTSVAGSDTAGSTDGAAAETGSAVVEPKAGGLGIEG